MPKIIENLRNRLIEEARRQIKESGYSAMTVRSVAKGCGVGVGTVYNYFPSKDILVASFMLEDWQKCIDAIIETAAASSDPRPVAQCIYEQLLYFMDLHEQLFRDEAAAAASAMSLSRYHGRLRNQLAAPFEKFCADAFTRDFIAEALLIWTVAGKEFDEIYRLIEKLF